MLVLPPAIECVQEVVAALGPGALELPLAVECQYIVGFREEDVVAALGCATGSAFQQERVAKREKPASHTCLFTGPQIGPQALPTADGFSMARGHERYSPLTRSLTGASEGGAT